MYVDLCGVYTHDCQFSGAGGCEPSDMRAGNWIGELSKSNKYF